MSHLTRASVAEARSRLRWRIPGVIPEKGQDVLTRVLGRCEIVGDCWEWRGAGANGYGRVHVDGRDAPAHRVVWEAVHGPIGDPATFVCHRCDNPPCCNPAHLFLGTAADNNGDRHAKGRTILPSRSGGGLGNSRKTHCIRGHEFTPENTYIRANGARSCIACRDLRDRGRERNGQKRKARADEHTATDTGYDTAAEMLSVADAAAARTLAAIR